MQGDPTTTPVAERHLVSPGNAIAALGVGHVAWGLAAYHRPLREIVGAGVVDSVGDGIFKRAHSDGPRAAGFWFLFAGPLTALCGYLSESALRSGDRRAATVSGASVLAIGAVGAAVMPRSGFLGALPVGGWLVRRALRIPADPERAIPR